MSMDETTTPTGGQGQDSPTVLDGTRALEQVNRLAVYIMENVDGEPSRSEGAVDCAIRVLGDLRVRVDELNSLILAGQDPPKVALEGTDQG